MRRHRYGTVLLWRKCSEAPAREGHLVREKDNLNGPEKLSAPRRDDWGGTPSKTGEHNRPRERATISVLDVEASEERHFPAPTIACIYTGPLADLLETLAAQACQARRSRGSNEENDAMTVHEELEFQDDPDVLDIRKSLSEDSLSKKIPGNRVLV